jgi:RHS repeat-associated protein
VTFANGDQLGARATAAGQVGVYKNGTLLGTRDVTGWPYYDDGGYIGLWFVSAEEAYADNFGGGSLGGQGKSAGDPGKESGVEAREMQPVSAWLKLHKGEQGGRKGMVRLVNTRRGSFVARPRSSPLEFSAGETITITYAYDSLYRLTAADYSDGIYFHYTYDSTGNRLTEQTQAGTTSYAYDIANRLTSVNGVTYTWDNNGNLLSDGVNTYTYDHANRLASASGGGYNASYGYSGTGDRLRQTVNGVTSSYTLDQNTGLTQVLADGTDTYLYGNGRIAQYGTSTDYFLGDALGSVRQLVDSSGNVTLAKSYQPYGSTSSSDGESATSYGFTGEWVDSYTQFVYLRARWYAPQTGRFLTRDTWQGNYQKPVSLNAWLYTSSNPINFADPSGMCPDEDGDGKCDPGWWCYSIRNPHTRDKCLLSLCLEPLLPWRRDGEYNRVSDSIPDWGVELPDNPKRIKNAGKVWDWICETGGPWGFGSCPPDDYLATWLLSHEQNLFQNDPIYRANSPDSETILGLVIQYFHADLVYFNRDDALGRQTAFYNPIQDNQFDKYDWDSLMGELNKTAKRQLERHWGDEYSTFMTKKLIWWEPNEPGFGGREPQSTMYGNPDHRIALKYYAIVNRP